MGISTVFYALMGGLNYTGLSLYFLPLIREFNVSYTKLSLLFSLRALEGGVEGPIAGLLVDRLGPRFMIVAGVLLGGFGFMLLSVTQSYLQFLLVLLAMVSIGFALPDHGASKAINQWFRRRLGLAMSLTSGGSATGGFLLTPLLAWVVLGYSWRWAAALSGLIMLTIGLPLAFLIRNPAPGETERDERPLPTAHGDLLARASLQGESANPSITATFSPQIEFTIGETLRTSTYWMLAMAIGLRLMGQQVLVVHMVPMLVSRGIVESVAATLLAVMAFSRLPSSLGAGLLADRWSRQRVATLAMVMGTLACATTILGPGTVAIGVLFAFLFGSAQSSNAITWALVGQYFGRKNFGTLRGGVQLLPSLLSAVGPLAAGWIFDQRGSYTFVLLGVAVIYSLSAIIFWIIRTPVKPLRQELG